MRRQQFQLMRGKLPSLDFIGRSAAIEDDDPPSAILDLPSPSDKSTSDWDEGFTVFDAEQSVQILGKIFSVSNPEKYVSRRHPDDRSASNSFVHCVPSVPLAKKYADIVILLEKQAVLEFTRDFVYCVKASSMFVRSLEANVCEEHRIWHNMMRNGRRNSSVTGKLFGLNSICEELRMHLNDWSRVKQKWYSNKWLKHAHHRLSLDIDYIRQTLIRLRNEAVRWIFRLVDIGLDVFANSDLDLISQESLWNVAKGIQDFNTIVQSINATGDTLPHQTSVFHPSSPSVNSLPTVRLIETKLTEVPFMHILSKIADHRAKRAALRTHHFFTENHEFTQIILRESANIPEQSHFVLNSLLYSPHIPVIQENHQNHHDTSDYHTATGSTASLSNMLLRIGNISAPDLSREMCPLIEFVEHEREFIIQLVHAVSNSTTFLHSKNGPNHSRLSRHKSPECSGRPPRGPLDESALIRASIQRKCVSWGDTADLSVRTEIMAKYLDALWRKFSEHLWFMLRQCTWDLDVDFAHIELGSIVFCNDSVPMVIKCMMEHVIVKDMFPAESVDALMEVANQLHACSALAIWDSAVCRVLPSMTSDKCYPCLLSDNTYCTKTCRLLCECIHSLTSILSRYSRTKHTSIHDALPEQLPDLVLTAGVLSRLPVTCKLATDWCTSKVRQCLTDTRIGQFLFILQTDVKILTGETSHISQLTDRLIKTHFSNKQSRSHLDAAMIYQLSNISQQLSHFSSSLQTLSGSAMKNFSEYCTNNSRLLFPEIMPLGKTWRCKSGADNVLEAQEYVSRAMDSLLEPVIDAVTKLSVTSQVTVISVATVATCDAWLDCILKNKVKFSLTGAQQLAADFSYARVWLAAAIHNVSVRQTVLELGVFKRMQTVVTVLQQQPKRRGERDVSVMSGLDLMNTNFSSNISNHTSHLNHVDADPSELVDSEQWLALRLHTESRWRLSGCLHSRETTV